MGADGADQRRAFPQPDSAKTISPIAVAPNKLLSIRKGERRRKKIYGSRDHRLVRHLAKCVRIGWPKRTNMQAFCHERRKCEE
jgi:hypothetical protein